MTDIFVAPPRDHNQPPIPALISDAENFAAAVTEFLNDRVRDSPATVLALLEEARALPAEIDDDDTKGKYTSLIKRIRDEAKRLEAFHENEKTNYFRGGQAVDQFFFGLIDRMARRSKTNKPGAADVLNARLTDYDTRKLREEQARRQAEADRLAREARERQEEEARKLAAAEAARLAAERARKPETVEAKTAVAEVAAAAATTAKVEAEVATGAAVEARLQTLAKPADIMRTRGAEGTLSTMAEEPFAEVVDADLLDKVKLWPFIKLEAKEQALRAWAKTTGHKPDSMPGASIGRRPKSVVR